MKIVLIEDDLKIADIIMKYARSQGYEIEHGKDGYEARELIHTQPHLFILDVMLPDTDGWSLLKQIRNDYETPVIMLTARSELDDKLLGFELGATDYVTKPFSVKELFARIKAHLKQKTKNEMKVGELLIDLEAHQVMCGDERLELSKTEFELLEYMTINLNIALSREKILNAVWGIDYFGDERTVDTHIKRLRRKLGDGGSIIKTIRGFGYKMTDEDIN